MPEMQGKILNLRDAVERYVKPGMQVHLAGGIGGPSAAICEIIRRFRGKNPGFTLIQSTVTGHGLNLVHTAQWPLADGSSRGGAGSHHAGRAQ